MKTKKMTSYKICDEIFTAENKENKHRIEASKKEKSELITN